jgi:hypothetical protein
MTTKQELQEYVYRIAQDIAQATDLMEYIENTLEISYIVNHARKYRGARILVTYGGPNVWIDTNKRAIEGYWGSEHAMAGLPRCGEIDDLLEESFDC